MLRKIFNFLFDSSEYILLIILIIASFIILTTNEVDQIRSLQGDIADIFSFVHYPRQTLDRLSNLVNENKSLKEKNVQLFLLNSEMKEAYLENIRLRNLLNFQDSTNFKLVAAEILNVGTTPIFNSFLVDVGKNSGVKPDMAVITGEGVIGKTVAVGDNSTIVQNMKDSNYRLSIKFQSSRVTGILKWYNGEEFIVDEIPKTSVVLPGDKVITSGYSDIYPGGIEVGVVLRVENSENGLHQNAYVMPNVNTNSVEELFIIIESKCYEKQ